jgi:hypothetical protein
MTKQNKNCRKQATLEQMVESDSQIVVMREDGSEQPIEEIIESQPGLCDYPFDQDFHYDNWWNQFRCPWLKSETMTEEQIRIKTDDAWECGDYKEMINLMAELLWVLSPTPRYSF